MANRTNKKWKTGFGVQAAVPNKVYRVRHPLFQVKDPKTDTVNVVVKGNTLDMGRNRHKQALRGLRAAMGRGHEIVQAMSRAELSARRVSFDTILEAQRG